MRQLCFKLVKALFCLEPLRVSLVIVCYDHNALNFKCRWTDCPLNNCKYLHSTRAALVRKLEGLIVISKMAHMDKGAHTHTYTQ